MIRKLLPLLVGSLAFAVTTPPAQAQTASCSQIIARGATLNTYHIFPRDPNLFIAPLVINSVSGVSWTGVFTTTNETVRGTISGSSFLLRRTTAPGQTWTAICSPTGISGNLRKDNETGVGAFLIQP